MRYKATRRDMLASIGIGLAGAVAIWGCTYLLNIDMFAKFSVLKHICTLGIIFGINSGIAVFVLRTAGENYAKICGAVITMLVLLVVLSDLVESHISHLAIPYVVLGITVSFVHGKQLAFFSNAMLSILVMFLSIVKGGEELEAVSVLLLSAVAGGGLIFLHQKSDSRIGSIYKALISAPLYMGVMALLWGLGIVSTEKPILEFAFVAVNPIIGVVLAIGFLPVVEYVFKILTAYRIVELGDPSKGLLLELSQKAPGTYQHSTALANLCAACAGAIGEDPQLARVCAMYHDVGKMKEPSLFIENQTAESGNPHDKMTPELSVALIRKHANDGREMLEKLRMPKDIILACVEHHGTMPVRYFLERAKKFSAGDVNISDYSYNTPKPTNKISALLMICDACEAAMRARGALDEESADAVVGEIIEERILLGQFSQSPITFADLATIREEVVGVYLGMHHKRIAYPTFEGFSGEVAPKS